MSASSPEQSVRVLLIDDSPLIRLGLRAALEDCRTITIVGEADTAAEGMAAVERLQPQVVLLDLRLPDRSGLELCREIVRQHAATRILILTSSSDERHVHEAIAAGAQGYLLKENDGATLASAILRVASGHSVLDPSLTDQVLNLMKRPPDSAPAGKLATLSLQERRVLALLADGLTNKEIGDRLGLTEKTVKNYLATVFDKLSVTRRAQAASLFVQATR
ncbi:MAG: response regulator transcription factor [Opitutaceae bacterium]|nr:response regulator transcription factor [Opitutaceae bacterium]